MAMKGIQWSRYRELKESQSITVEDLYQRIYNVYYGRHQKGRDEMLGAALAFAFLFGNRISEMIAEYKFEKVLSDLPDKFNKIQFYDKGVMRKNIWVEEDPNGNEYLIGCFRRRRKGNANIQEIISTNQKECEIQLNHINSLMIDDKEKTIKEDDLKQKYLLKIHEQIHKKLDSLDPVEIEILISCKGEATKDLKFALILKDYLENYLPKQKNLNLQLYDDELKYENTPLFDISRSNLEMRLKKFYPDLSWHFLRRLRVKFLQVEYNFSVNDLKEYFRWSTVTMPTHYNESTRKDLRLRYSRRMEELEEDNKILQTVHT